MPVLTLCFSQFFNRHISNGALGKKDEAFALLDKAYQERANGLSVIKAIPLVDDLRSDPRFDELLKRLKLT